MPIFVILEKNQILGEAIGNEMALMATRYILRISVEPLHKAHATYISGTLCIKDTAVLSSVERVSSPQRLKQNSISYWEVLRVLYWEVPPYYRIMERSVRQLHTSGRTKD